MVKFDKNLSTLKYLCIITKSTLAFNLVNNSSYGLEN